VELELEDEPLPELESLDDDELELLPLDDDLELAFFLRGAAGLRLTGGFLAFGFLSLSEEDVLDELLLPFLAPLGF
jgi:hypothetical protein